jgi:hypothetical protein
MSKISKSPDRHTFQAESSKKKLEENPNDENALRHARILQKLA